jgi:hypothetical protein
MNARSSRHSIAFLATVAALIVFSVQAFTVSPPRSDFRAIVSKPAIAVPQDEPVPEQADLSVSAVIGRIKSQYVVGDVPQIQVWLQNDSTEPVILLGSVDGSGSRRRYPHCYFEIEGPPEFEGEWWGAGCGNLDPLRRRSFVTVEPREQFDPYSRDDGFHFMTYPPMNWRTFAAPGKYRLTWVYSTASNDPQKWVGDGTVDPIRDLLERVPRGTVRSNTVEIEYAAPPGGYVPHTHIPRNHSEAHNRGTWFIFRLLATGALNLRLSHERYIWLFDGLRETPDGEQLVSEFNNLYRNLHYEISPLVRAGHDVSRPTTLAVLRPVLSVIGDASLDEFDNFESGLRELPRTLAKREAVLESIAELVADERCQEEAIVLFVFSELKFGLEDVPELNPVHVDQQKVAVVRVTRQNGSWIPEIVKQP